MKAQGFNEFVFNAHLPVARKNNFLEMTEKQQINALVNNKGAFSAGGQWCHVGVQLLGSEAVTTAQLLQLQKEQKKARDAKEKKATARTSRVDKARETLALFSGKEGSSGEDAKEKQPGKEEYKKIVMFLLSRLDKNVAPSKVTSSMKKMKEKLDDLESKKNKSWLALVEEEIAKAESESADHDGEQDENEVTEKIWEELEIEHDEVGDDDRLKNLFPVTQAEL